MKPTNNKALDFLGDDSVEISTGDETLKNEKDFHDAKWLEESQAKPLKQFIDEITANLFMSRIEKKQ